MRQLRLYTLTICGLLSAAALARAHDLAFPGPPPGAGGPPPGAMMSGMYPGMQGVFPGPYGASPYGPPPYAGPQSGHGFPGPVAGEGGPDVDCCEERSGPMWSIAIETVIMRRQSARQQTLVREGAFDLNGRSLLETDDLIFDHEMAPRLTALLHVNHELAYEVSYLNIDDWAATAVVVEDNDISVSSPNILLDTFNAARFDYRSEFTSIESNVRWRMMKRITLLAGLRFMELTDGFEQTDNFPGLQTFAPSYTIATRNRMMGGQFGGVFSLLRFGPVCLDGFAKWGYFINEAEHNMHDVLNLGFGNLEAFNTEHTSIVETGLNVTCCFNQHVRAWAGYSTLWLNGVATAPSQIPGNDLFGNGGVAALGPIGAVGVDVSDNIRIDGFNAGLEFSY